MSSPGRLAVTAELTRTCHEIEEAGGHFHCDALRSHGSCTQPTWHVTTQPHIAERVAALLGGQLKDVDGGFVEVATEITELAISLPGPEAIRLR
jgi:hypothetical protein